MTKVAEEWINQQLSEIRRVAETGDFEWAHQMEDDLHRRVLQYVANGGMHARAFARLALTSATISFTRAKA